MLNLPTLFWIAFYKERFYDILLKDSIKFPFPRKDFSFCNHKDWRYAKKAHGSKSYSGASGKG